MPKEVGDVFAERVRRRLEALDWTTDHLGQRMGIDGSGIRKVLNEARAPRIDTLLRWADALGCSVEHLLGRDVDFHERVASQEQIDALKAHAVSIGLSKDRLALVLFALDAREAAVSVAVGGLPEGK